MSAVKKPRARKAPRIHELALSQIVDDAQLQPRQQMDLDILREFSNAWLDQQATDYEGKRFPPIDVFFDGEVYWLADGFYRVRSARKANLESIKATVHDGGKREAILFSVGANAFHGVRRTNEDKRKAILTLLDDPEWCLWSNKEIARACNVGDGSVSRYRTGSPGVRGHNVTTRITGNGTLRSTPEAEAEEGLPPETFRRPPTMMSQAEIHDKFVRRIITHLRKTEADVVQDLAYPLGTIDIASATTLYSFAVVTSQSDLYRILGKLFVARPLINRRAKLSVIGHFPRAVANLIVALAEQGIVCETPEQLLAR